MRMVFTFLAVIGMSIGDTHAADGDLDPAFGVAGLARAGVTRASDSIGLKPVIQPDGKILVCSAVLGNAGSGDDFLVVRFSSDGALDTDFSFDGRVAIDFSGSAGSDRCNAIALQPDGKIIVAGSTVNLINNSDFAVARLNADGSLDTTFGSGTGKRRVGFDLGGGNFDVATDVLLQADGKIVLGGFASTANNGDDFAIARLLTDGTADAEFNLSGRVSFGFTLSGGASGFDTAMAMALDNEGRILIAGSSAATVVESDFALARVLPNGQLDSNFDADGRVSFGFGTGASSAESCFAVLVQDDGRIVLAGRADSSGTSAINYDMAVARLLPDGSDDMSFGFAGKTLVSFALTSNGADTALGMVRQPNGRLLLAGIAQYATNYVRAAVARLQSDGSLDMQFGVLGRKSFDLGLTNPDLQYFTGIALQGNQIIASGIVQVGPTSSDLDKFVVRLQNDLIFADGFD